MGWDYAFRFKGIVKEQYRSVFKDIALHGKWAESSNELFRYIGENYYNARCIPASQTFAQCGWLSAWEGCDEEGKEFETQYDEQSGLWVFGTVFRDRTLLLTDFMSYVLPYAFEKVLYMETWCELEDNPQDFTKMCNNDIEDLKSYYLDMNGGYPKWIKKEGYPEQKNLK